MSKSTRDIKGKSTPRTEKAFREKETGNEFFNKGNYVKAIEHYGRAIELDPKDSVFVINRAQAYLKLKRWAEAELDCNQGLMIQPDNVKALWRRGIARREQKKFKEAKQDLYDALELDPNNRAAKDELTKVLNALGESQTESGGASEPIKVPDEEKVSTEKAPRRRLHIKEVETEEDDPVDSSVNLAEKTQQKNSVTLAPVEDASKEGGTTLKQNSVLSTSSQESNPTKIIPPVSNTLIPSEAKVSAPVSLRKIEPPRFAHDFERKWNMYSNNDEDLYLFLKSISPSNFPSILSEFFESDYLSRMIIILRDMYFERDTVDNIYEVLYYLSRVGRFQIILSFLEKEDRQALKELFAKMLGREARDDQKITREKIQQLSEVYQVNPST